MKKSIVRIIAFSLVAIMMCVALVSCGGPNADPDKAIAALEKNGYAAEKIDGFGLVAFAWAGGDVEAVVTAVDKNDLFDFVTIIYYEDEAAANEAWENVEKYYGEYLENLQKTNEEQEGAWKIDQSKNMIYYGSVDAIKAAK